MGECGNLPAGRCGNMKMSNLSVRSGCFDVDRSNRFFNVVDGFVFAPFRNLFFVFWTLLGSWWGSLDFEFLTFELFKNGIK